MGDENGYVITKQPTQGVPSHISHVSHMSQIPSSALCPPGMELLLMTSMIIVQQKLEMLEIFSGINTNNRYQLLDMAGRRMYFAAEQSGCCLICCFGAARPFTILVLDNRGSVVLKIKRESGCLGGCCCMGVCCNVVKILTPADVVLGEVKQECIEGCIPKYSVMDEMGEKKLMIEGPCKLCICCDVHFKVRDMNGDEIGDINKKFAGVIQEAFTNADTFMVSFPMDLDPRLKCLLLGAVFLIDFMYFEKSQNSN